MSKQELYILKVNHGVANRFSDCIEVNKHLIDYPDLYRPIIKHELEHTDNFWTFKDFFHDINAESKINRIQLLKFMFKHPKSFTQIMPIYYCKRRKFVVDLNLSIVYLILGFIGLGIYSWLY